MIVLSRTYGRTAVAAAAFWVLAACALPVEPPPSAPPYSVEDATRTFAAGYQQISERYIDPLPVSEVVLAGLAGLDVIDPVLTVAHEGDSIVLSAHAAPVRRFSAPAANDVEGWARLTVDVSLSGRAASRALRDATLEHIYEVVFDAAAAHLDRFSRYTAADRASENRARRRGFGGIGIQYQWTQDGAVVREVIADSPADAAGLKVGDVVTHVGGQSVVGAHQEYFREKLRGDMNTPVTLSVRRGDRGETLSFEMTRRRIFIPTVNTEARDGIVIARINGFNSRTARHLSEQFRAAERASLIPLRGVVIDLRGNPGGLLRQAVSVADLFLRQGHIVSTRGRHPDSVHDFVARESDLAAGLPVVVVVNGKSASSAEIVAAALQDHDRAVVVGTTSFGKGTVQTVARLPNDGELTLTWSRFIAPSGYFLHGLGVVPTVCTRGVGDPRAIVATALERMEETAHTVAEWRSVAYDDRSGRDRLRALCPGSDADGDLDIEVAKMLLNDANAYRRAAAGSPAIVSTAHAR